VLAEPVGMSLLIGFGLILVSLMLVLGIMPSVRLPWTIRRAIVGQGIGG
jgi:hypothetical protein